MVGRFEISGARVVPTTGISGQFIRCGRRPSALRQKKRESFLLKYLDTACAALQRFTSTFMTGFGTSGAACSGQSVSNRAKLSGQSFCRNPLPSVAAGLRAATAPVFQPLPRIPVGQASPRAALPRIGIALLQFRQSFLDVEKPLLQSVRRRLTARPWLLRLEMLPLRLGQCSSSFKAGSSDGIDRSSGVKSCSSERCSPPPFSKTAPPIYRTPRLFSNLLPQSNLHRIAAKERKEHKENQPFPFAPFAFLRGQTFNLQPSTLN